MAQTPLLNALTGEDQRAFKRALSFKLADGVFAGLIALIAFSAIMLASTGTPAIRLIPALLGVTFLLVVLRHQAGARSMRHLNALAFKAGIRLRSNVLRHLIRLPLSSFYKLHPGKVAQTLSEDMMWVENQAAHFGPMARAETATILVLLAGVAAFHWPAALAAILFWGLGLWTLRKLAANLAGGLRFRSDALAEAARHFMEYAEGIQVVRAFGDRGEARREFSKWTAIMREGFRKGIARNTPITVAAQGLAMAAVGFGTLVTILTLGEGETPRALGAIGLLTATLIPARAIILGTTIKEIATVAEENIAEMLALPQVVEGDIKAEAGPAQIRFEKVSFAYQGDDLALKDVSFTAEPGTVTAIVGPSGSGKTTLANLMLRFWEPQAGRVTLNGRDIRDYTMGSFTDRFAPVFQETMLLRDSIEANIRIGRPDATTEEVVAAAKAAQIHDTIAGLPDGYATKVGPGGQTLSGGERQRITLARAILKDADIVILDEATSALDPENEREIQLAFEALAREKTVFVIAHRLSTIVEADQILLLDQGSLLATGTHDELLTRAPLYQALWESYDSISKWTL